MRPLSLKFVLVWRRQHGGRTDRRRTQSDRLQCCCNDAAYIQKSTCMKAAIIGYIYILYIIIYLFFKVFFTAEIRGWSQKIRGYSPECPGLATRLPVKQAYNIPDRSNVGVVSRSHRATYAYQSVITSGQSNTDIQIVPIRFSTAFMLHWISPDDSGKGTHRSTI